MVAGQQIETYISPPEYECLQLPDALALRRKHDTQHHAQWLWLSWRGYLQGR